MVDQDIVRSSFRKIIFSDKFGSLKIGLHHFYVFDHSFCEQVQFKNRCEIVSCTVSRMTNPLYSYRTIFDLNTKHYSISCIETS